MSSDPGFVSCSSEAKAIAMAPCSRVSESATCPILMDQGAHEKGGKAVKATRKQPLSKTSTCILEHSHSLVK
jgi:hypothetical protein